MKEIEEIIKIKKEPIQVEVNWKGDGFFEADIGNFKLPLNGPNANFTPAELLLVSIGGCYISKFQKIAEKMRINLSDLKLKIVGLKEEDFPRFLKIDVVVKAKAKNVDKDKLQRVFNLAEKYCTVTNTLKSTPEVHFSLEQ